MFLLMIIKNSLIILSLFILSLMVMISIDHHQQQQQQQFCSDEFHKECHCGSPAMPPSTSLFTRIVYPNSTIKVELYNESIPYGYAKYLRVYYKCTDDRDVLVGNNMRECSKGNWIGFVPRCAINNLNQTKLSHVKVSDFKVIDTTNSKENLFGSFPEDKPINVLIYYDESLQLNPNGSFQVPLINQPHDCLRWSLSPKQVWSLNLDRKTLVHYVRLKLYGDHIEDLYLNHEIGIDLSLTNISIQISKNHSRHIDSLPLEIKCIETIPKESQFSAYHQKYSANYLVLDFLCEIEEKEKSLYEFLFAEDYDIDELVIGVIKIGFEMFNILHIDNGQNIDLEFKQKIFVISLCELHLYSFEPDCGAPDLPVTAIVQRDFNFIEDNGHVRKSYRYTCPYNQEIKGNPDIECGYYGEWKTEFPICEHNNPCSLLKNLTFMPGYLVDVKYETTMMNKKYKDAIVPNGKFAEIICIRLNDRSDVIDQQQITDKNASFSINMVQNNNESTMNQKTISQLRRDVSRIKCLNGKWNGMESVDCIMHKLILDENPISNNVSDTELNRIQVVSLPVRLIQILFVLFIFLLLIIICLLIYMIIFRKRMTKQVKKQNSKELNQGGIATQQQQQEGMFQSSGILGMPTLHFDPTTTYRPNFYSSNEDFYERITLEERDSHLYHTIPNPNQNNIQSHYSDLSLYPSSSIKLSTHFHQPSLNLDAGEERYNSIYGLEEDCINTDQPNRQDSSKQQQQQQINGVKDFLETTSTIINNDRDSLKYNSLSRSSTSYLRRNSIYEET
ncbi:hypothetical protein DERP_002354 [Dermatophagoides pteronyssinus]|uniref:Sushi domain-containing protein n=1 Tax=Dermatophagoides pteronyssinus TaxID=6956 RepID=A0ABQ8JHG8_DERPT|nr:hypothetical protein DERP_002354 [Dermatophagoides pteronyssinus]